MSSGVRPRSRAISVIGRGFTLLAISMSEGTVSGTMESSLLVAGTWARVDEAPAKPALDAQIALGDGVVERRGRLHDLAVLDVQRQRAADTAIRTDRVGRRLARFVPRALAPQVELPARHERARRADGDAVAAVDTRRVRKLHVELGRDAR